MRSTLNVKEIPLRLFLLRESQRTSLSLDLDLVQLNFFQVCAPISELNLSAIASPFENIWHAHSERSTAEGNLLLLPNHQTTKAVVERATKRQTKNIFDCVQIAASAETLKISEFLQVRPARDSAGLLSISCGEADRPTCVGGGQVLRRIILGSRLGPVKERNIFKQEGSSGIDVKVPSTNDPEISIWVHACTDEVQNCRQIAAIKTIILTENPSNETSEASGNL